MKPSDVKCWGVDIGNVLIENFVKDIKDESKITWEAISKNGRLISGAIEGLKFLIEKVGPDNVWIVSKVSPIQQKVSEMVFENLKICEKTGLLSDHIRFCLERKDKAPIIKKLGLEGHIDDRGEVIESLQVFLPCPIWFNPSKKDYTEWNKYVSSQVLMVPNWSNICSIIKCGL